jgi:hypothetical protein
MDFWLQGHLKILVYLAPINDLQILQQRVENACQKIRVKPEIFDRVRISVRRRAESCSESWETHTYSVCCTDYTNIAHISASITYWTQANCDILTYLS